LQTKYEVIFTVPFFVIKDDISKLDEYKPGTKEYNYTKGLGRDGTVADTVRYFRQISVTVYKL
jgi:hypothetical protein